MNKIAEIVMLEEWCNIGIDLMGQLVLGFRSLGHGLLHTFDLTCWISMGWMLALWRLSGVATFSIPGPLFVYSIANTIMETFIRIRHTVI
jgi:hypothetical protein